MIHQRSMPRHYGVPNIYRTTIAVLLGLFISINHVSGQCPWQRDVPTLQTSCICAYNLGHELSVQCDQVTKINSISTHHYYYKY